MGGGAFERLKAGRFRPESTEQRKAGVAGMSKILPKGPGGPAALAAGRLDGALSLISG
jgi:hypothetical protein